MKTWRVGREDGMVWISWTGGCLGVGRAATLDGATKVELPGKTRRPHAPHTSVILVLVPRARAMTLACGITWGPRECQGIIATTRAVRPKPMKNRWRTSSERKTSSEPARRGKPK